MPVPQASVRRRPLRSRRTATALTAFIAGLAVAPGTASAMQVEQISRADGTTGASPAEFAYAPGFISDDGATSYVEFNQSWGTWSTATGLWQRTVATNRSNQVVGGSDAKFAGFGADGTVIGVRTARRLSTADTNSAVDLYTYDVARRTFTLASRRDGVNGTATGIVAGATLTRDGRAALFGAPDGGIHRRDLATGRTVRVADGYLTNATDEGASTDGTVFATSGGVLVSPSGTWPITTEGTTAPQATVSPGGRRAVVTATQSETGRSVTFALDVATGTRTTLDPVALDPAQGFLRARVTGFLSEDRVLVARSISSSTAASSFEVVAVSLPSGAATRVAAYAVPLYALRSLSRNGRFAALEENGSGYAASADGVSLPGGADLPSPGAYFVVDSGCRASGFPSFYPAGAGVFRGTRDVPQLPRLSTIRIRMTTTSGAVVSDTVLPGTGANWPTQPLGPFGLTATATYPDGRVTTESWQILGPNRTCTVFG